MVDKYKVIIEKLNELNDYSSKDFIDMSVNLMNHHLKAKSFIDERLKLYYTIKKETPNFVEKRIKKTELKNSLKTSSQNRRLNYILPKLNFTNIKILSQKNFQRNN